MKTKNFIFMLNKIMVDLTGKKTPYDMETGGADRQLGYYYFKFKENPKKLNRLIRHPLLQILRMKNQKSGEPLLLV